MGIAVIHDGSVAEALIELIGIGGRGDVALRSHVIFDIGHEVADLGLMVADAEQRGIHVEALGGLVGATDEAAVDAGHEGLQVLVVLLELVLVLHLLDDELFRLLGAHVLLDAFGQGFLFLFEGVHARVVDQLDDMVAVHGADGLCYLSFFQ